MAGNFIVRTINLNKHYDAAASRYKRGGRVLFRCGGEAVHEQGFFHPDNKVMKKIERDMLLKKILKKVTEPHFTTLKKEIDSTIKNATLNLITDDGKWVYTTTNLHSKALNKVEEEIHKHVAKFDNKSNPIMLKKANDYIEDRLKAGLNVKLLKIKKIQKVFEAGTTVVAGVGGGIMMTVLTGGTAVFGLVGGCYASYQSCKGAIDIFRRSHKDITEVATSIKATIATLDYEYDMSDTSGSANKKTKRKMNRREIRATAATLFLSTNDVVSVKKLNVQVANFSNKTAKMIVNASKMGKAAGKLNEDLKKLKNAVATVEKNARSPEAMKALKNNTFKKLAPGLTGMKKNIDLQKKFIKDLVSEAVKIRVEAKDYQLDILYIKRALNEYNTKMPDAVWKAEAFLKAGHFLVGVAPIVTGAVGGVYAEKAGSTFKQILELHNNFVDTANAGRDEIGLKEKKLKHASMVF